MVGGPGLLLLPLLAGLGASVSVLPEHLPPPVVNLVFDDGSVTVYINTSVHPVYATFNVILQNMKSSAESEIKPVLPYFEILYKDLHAGVIYCLNAQVCDSRSRQYSPFSAARCFTPSKGLPENLRVEGLNTIYVLKWDWDYEKNPNVTFSVEQSYFYTTSWKALEGCENITTLECNVSSLDLHYSYRFRVSVYNSETKERNSNIATYNPLEDTVIGPPTFLNLTLQHNDLHITVVPPEVFHISHFRQYCTWEYHLERWKNATPTEVITMQNKGIHFTINGMEASTTYCARAFTKCKARNRTGLYSKIYCITTAARSYIKELIIGSVFMAIIVISAILYICLCPLKRYLRHVFFPKSKLPSSIEKSMQDSPRHYIKTFFLLHEEEKTDRCYIMQNSLVDAEAGTDKKSLEDKGCDSGNYSNECEVTDDSSTAQ